MTITAKTKLYNGWTLCGISNVHGEKEPIMFGIHNWKALA
jgi:hypothetical protein